MSSARNSANARFPVPSHPRPFTSVGLSGAWCSEGWLCAAGAGLLVISPLRYPPAHSSHASGAPALPGWGANFPSITPLQVDVMDERGVCAASPSITSRRKDVLDDGT